MTSAKFEQNPIKRCGPGALYVHPFSHKFCSELDAKMYFLGASHPLVILGHRGIGLTAADGYHKRIQLL